MYQAIRRTWGILWVVVLACGCGGWENDVDATTSPAGDAISIKGSCQVEPASVAAGDTYAVQCAGLPPSTALAVQLSENGVVRTVAVSSDRDGTFAVTAAAEHPGPGTVTVRRASGRQSTLATCSFTVVAPPPVDPPAPQPGTFEFAASAYAVSERDGQLAVTIRRVGGADGAVTVDFRTGQLTAQYGADYVGIPTKTLTFADGETSRVETVTILADAVAEDDESFKVLLSNPTGGATLGAVTEALVTIQADTVVPPPPPPQPLRAFPGAEGYGTDTVAGRGGQILRVTNLNDSGVGSLRAAVTASGPRTVVFEVSGIIRLANFIQIRNPYLTVAGQTAPAPGITLRGKGCFDIRTHDVLIQHLRLRAGDPNGTAPAGYEDGFQITGSSTAVYNVVIDHISASWALDENGAIWAADNITVSNSLFSESLYTHKGFLIGNNSDNISFHHNLLMHNSERHPRINAGTSVVMYNNLFYNIGVQAHTEIGQPNAALSTPNPDHAARVSAVGNVYRNGSNTLQPMRAFNVFTAADHAINAGTELYLLDNTVDGLPMTSAHLSYRTLDPRVSASPLPLGGLTILPSSQVEASLVANVGARPADRDAVDQRMMTELTGHRGEIPASVAALGANGWSALAATSTSASFDAGPNPLGDDDGDGYTNVEEILARLAAEVEGR